MTATLTLVDLEPTLVWKHFDEIRKIPRGSGNEAACAAYVVGVAERLGIQHRTDEAGNVIMTLAPTAGRESAESIVLQSHLDMVNEKNADTVHDFDKDPIDAYVDGEWVRARGTTLGSDNGIGVAMALAVAEDDTLEHGPIELLFTLDEETGMTGAMGLKSDALVSRRMINLDTEEENAIYIGCAGGVDVLIDRPLARGPQPAGLVARELSVSGLTGGHSGCDIHLGRGNANRILTRTLQSVAQKVDLCLGDIRGGNLRNALPREATAVILFDPASEDEVKRIVATELEGVLGEIGRVDPDIIIDLCDVVFPPDAKVATVEDSKAMIDFLCALPHGVDAMSHAIEGLVETSTNFATMETTDDGVRVVMLSRSSVKSGLDAMNARIHALVRMAGGTSREEGEYPGWAPDPDSELLKTAIRVHEKVLGVTPVTKAIHAGLECGVIGEKFPGMQTISLGPRIEGAHSPDERVHIATVERSQKLLLALLTALS